MSAIRDLAKVSLSYALKCPFCSDLSPTLGIRKGYMLVCCSRSGCWAEGPRATRHDLLGHKREDSVVMEEAIRKWNARTTMDAIHAQLDRKSWGPHTLDDIANLLRNAGYTIREPKE